MTIDRVIATVSLIGCVWLFSTAGIWGEQTDNQSSIVMDCKK